MPDPAADQPEGKKRVLKKLDLNLSQVKDPAAGAPSPIKQMLNSAAGIKAVTPQAPAAAAAVTRALSIPTIGCGSGPHCDGQVLVLHDLVGLFRRFTPKFVKVYTDLYSPQLKAVQEFIGDIRAKRFPGDEHSFTMKSEAMAELRKELKL
jgi:3-methyl-2-oxobutanoate hydroxymethyltransferase